MQPRDVIPPPPKEYLCKIQLMRTMLVKFLEWRNFDEVVRGCYVRVLLEMRGDGRAQGMGDSYYVAQVKGAKEGPEYSGFSWEKTTTKWHIIIELPPCFRATPNGNVVQLNSISNTSFKDNEYQQWVEMTRQAGLSFIGIPQIELRLRVLEDDKACVMSPSRGGRKGHRDETAEQIAAREQKVSQLKTTEIGRIRGSYYLMPTDDGLNKMNVHALNEVEQKTLDILSQVRFKINEKSKCRICKMRVCTVVCWPCKHQVMCNQCAPSITECPVCGKFLEDKFEAFGPTNEV